MYSDAVKLHEMMNIRIFQGSFDTAGMFYLMRGDLSRRRERMWIRKKKKKELNLVAWNDREPKYDIRDWDPEHERMSKGITLLPEEMHRIVEAVVDRDFTPRDAAKENIER